jgi:DNA replication protein DnaC
MAAESKPESLGRSLRAVLGHDEYARLLALAAEAPPDDVDLVCPRCKGAGWLRFDRQVGTADFARLIECSCGLVADRRASTYRAASRIPAEYANLDLDTFPDPRIAEDMRAWWSSLPTTWLVLVGELGVGKTGLAIGLVKRALADGRPALFRSFVELLSDIRATYRTRDAAEPDEADLMTALKTANVLALDDLGADRATGWSQDRLYEILNHRYNERRRTILTTSLGPDELEAHVGDRLVSRINGMGWIYQILGPNLREAR